MAVLQRSIGNPALKHQFEGSHSEEVRYLKKILVLAGSVRIIFSPLPKYAGSFNSQSGFGLGFGL